MMVVSTYMMNLFKLARDSGIFCQYEDPEVTRDPERRGGAKLQGKTTKFGSIDDSAKPCLPFADKSDSSITKE